MIPPQPPDDHYYRPGWNYWGWEKLLRLLVAAVRLREVFLAVVFQSKTLQEIDSKAVVDAKAVDVAGTAAAAVTKTRAAEEDGVVAGNWGYFGTFHYDLIASASAVAVNHRIKIVPLQVHQ
jgi:hypothetical protein